MLHKPRNKQYREGRGGKRGGGSGILHCTVLYMLHRASGKAHTVEEAAGLSETREEEGGKSKRLVEAAPFAR